MRANRLVFFLPLAFSVVLTGCCLKKPKPWTPNPIHTPPQAAGEFNVLWDQEDVNGFPSNPYWEAQTDRYQAVLPPLSGTQYASCIQEPYLKTPVEPGQEACTVQDTVIDTPEDFPNVFCFLYPGSTVHGHVNWTVASAAGHVSWLNLADDWDYNFRLIPAAENSPPQRDRGLTTNNNRVISGNNNSPLYIELEFASSEVADQFRTPWWQGLANLVDPLQLPTLRRYIHRTDPNQDPFAVAVGLFGLDCEHDCRSEYHPVYALAIQLDEAPQDNVWALFVRNWGDEGFCSSLNHELNLTDEKMRLVLPWPGAKGLKAEIEQLSLGAGLPDVDLLQDANGVGQGAMVSFSLAKPADRRLVEAVLHFHWDGGTAPQPRPASTEPVLAALNPQLAAEGEQDAEQRLQNLRVTAGVTGRPKPSGATLQPAPAAITPGKVKTHVYRLSKVISKPPVLLGEQIRVPVECGGAKSTNPCPVDTVKHQQDIDLWKKICAGLKGNYPDDITVRVCIDPRLR